MTPESPSGAFSSCGQVQLHLLYPGGATSPACPPCPVPARPQNLTHHQAEIAKIKLLLHLGENVRVQGLSKPHDVGPEEPVAAILLTPVQEPQRDPVTLLVGLSRAAEQQSSLTHPHSSALPTASSTTCWAEGGGCRATRVSQAHVCRLVTQSRRLSTWSTHT